MQAKVSIRDLAPLCEVLGVDPSGAHVTGVPEPQAPPGPVDLVVAGPLAAGVGVPAVHAEELERALAGRLAPGARVLLAFGGREEDATLARWRNALWPLLHAVGVCRSSQGQTRLETLGGTRTLESPVPLGAVLVLARRDDVLAPEATVEKFDANAAGWNGDPSSPGYPHHRWMRRLVGRYAHGPAERILDFGSGAGWVGIEAALARPAARLRLFDPSPEMVATAVGNARAAGIADVEGRTGFGEDPPFPGPKEAPFDLVLSSGVVSFSPEPERWFDGLAQSVAPGGTLVLGDIQRESRGFRRRRDAKPLVPVREMNALTHEEARRALERRGFELVRWSGYQLSWPIPQAMHWSETRARGLLSPALLLANRMAATCDRWLGGPLPAQFDSWVMELSKRG